MVIIAVAGASKATGPVSANLGSRIVKALLSKGATVKLLVRPESPTDLEQAGAQLVSNSARLNRLQEPETLEGALRGVDVVLSTVAGPAIATQTALAQAAKAAGVKLFFLIEFGNNTARTPPGGPLDGKKAIQAELQRLDLLYTLVFNGLFAEFAANFAKSVRSATSESLLTISDGKIHIVGDDNALVSLSALDSVADFVGRIIIVNFPPFANTDKHTEYTLDKLAWAVLPIEDARLSFNALSKISLDRDPSAQIEFESIESARKRLETNQNFLGYLTAEWAVRGEVAPVEERKNDLYPGGKEVDPRSFV